MNAAELKKRLESLPRYQFIILAGGSMVMHGLREETNDVDICVSQNLADELGLSGVQPNEKGYYELPNDLDVTVGMDRFPCEQVDGYLCQRLEEILKFKKRRNEPKDQQDIERIEEYFAQQGRS
ncbi:hypothetical protein IKG06_04225 [Candidatus Saccharibacteria bacterium]|nr:hypothetical protein [Candidatus Saccharibacteria bacterium]